jgi:hypothetical protein
MHQDAPGKLKRFNKVKRHIQGCAFFVVFPQGE